VFHANGDTGGVKAPQPQQIVAMHMEGDVESSDPGARPAFFYHLGDVVYYYGQAEEYYGQFYEPYHHYPGPIFAIPGNHDGDILDDSVPSLAAFVENFCSPEPQPSREAGDSPRTAMTQPNVYWTLDAPFATIVGVYTNVPEGGQLDDQQITWLESELRTAPADKALILALHHPIFSADAHHGGSERMHSLLNQTIQRTGRVPDMVLTGHVHNYQRFTEARGDRQVPYIVAGAGGYWHLHYMQKVDGHAITLPFQTPDNGVTLESFCDDRHGFLRLEVTADALIGKYYAVPRPQEPWRVPPKLVDSFTLDLKKHRLGT
jgi:hypothetical protein